MISASHPGEALAQLQLGHLGHLYPAPPAAAMTPEFLTPPPRPYPRYPARRPRETPAPAPFSGYAPFLNHTPYAYLYGTRPQPPAAYPLRPRSSSGFVPPAPAQSAPLEPPVTTVAPVPPSIEEAPMSPERGAPAPYFYRGAMIRLEDGSLRRVEEMRTEDFVNSASRSSDLALTKCTLLRLDERGDQLALTLTYDRNRTQVELDWTVDRPFFVYGRGWASCKPERTLARYGLRVQRLQVGDVCVSLVARNHAAAVNAGVTSNPVVSNSLSVTNSIGVTSNQGVTSSITTCLPAPPQTHPENLSVKEDARKRRWSASDVNEDDRPPLKKR
ncbi:ataxin-1 [Battus philenor]|uniref:ataxin-1 n=1 Tax=Battus philenor TaxID=42288 RepID=UPI0035CF8474